MKWPSLWFGPINLWNAPKVDDMGQDAGMDASPSWQKLKDERDALAKRLDRADDRAARQRELEAQLQGEINKLEAAIWERDEAQKIANAVMGERDALASHIDLINACFKSTSAMLPADWQAEMFWLFAQVPETSLARLKAQWQAEALESHARTLISQHRCDEMLAARTVHDVLLSEADKLRRQAEGE